MTGCSKVTIRDVALQAGVSVATVSLVIGDSPKVAVQTRRKVLEAIDRLHYIPNQYAAALRKQKKDVFAVLIPDLNNPFYLEIIRGLKDCCSQEGVVLHISETRHDYATEKAELRFLRSLQTSGYVFIGTVLDDDLIDELTHCRVVTIDKVYGAHNRYPQIQINNRACLQQAVSYLADQGCRKIAFMTPPVRTFSQQERLEGFVEAMEAAGLAAKERLLVTRDSPLKLMQAGFQAMSQQLARDRPDAVIATSDLLAIGAMKAALVAGLSIPEDVSVVGFDNSLIGQFYQPALTTFRLPLKTMGELAFSLLTEEPIQQHEQQLVTADFVIRDSVRQ